MNNLLDSIPKFNARWIDSSLFAFLVLGNWINHWLYFACVISVAAIISIIRFFHDKKWLFDTDKYIRIVIVTPIWKQILSFILILGVTLLFIENLESFPFLIHSQTKISWLILTGFLLSGNYYQKFVSSIKSFEDGIQFPGRDQEIIPWREIYDFTVDEKIQISSSKGEQEFDIHKDDHEHAQAMITDWKSKNGKRN